MKDQISILVIGNFLSATHGSRSVCEDFAEHLADSNWRVLTTSRKPGRIARLLDMLWTVWAGRDHYQLATVDTFSGLSFLWAEMVGLVLYFLKKPFILILHGGNLPEFSQQSPWRIKRLFKLATAVTAPSQYLVEKMLPYRRDLILLPNSIDLSKYIFISRKKPKPVLVWLRAFHAIYNAPLAINTLRILTTSHPNSHLFMGGDDKGDGSFHEVKNLSNALGISEKIEFFGKIPNADVPNWLQNGDIFINTTNVDNTPISILEAMACGLCIVSTNVGGIPYLLNDGQDALLVPPDNPEEMSAAVYRILTEPGLAERLSTNAWKKVKQFSWSMILPQWENLFYEILDIKPHL